MVMAFDYLAAPQRSPEWFNTRLGKVTASRLSDWLAVSRAKATMGKPLKARLDYEKELMFERQFLTSFNNYVTLAMQDGIDYEDFAARQYEQATSNRVEECGCWYNDYFVASPDRTVGDDGLLEIKVVKDATFTDILTEGVPDAHWKQIQGQLFASGRQWCDYLALNLNTCRFIILRVEPDREFFAQLEVSLQEEVTVPPFPVDDLHPILGTVPAASGVMLVDNLTGGNW